MLPVAGKTKLQLAPEGIAVLRGISTPVSPVVVIGPYRSGKSFMLNQLLGVSCGACSCFLSRACAFCPPQLAQHLLVGLLQCLCGLHEQQLGPRNHPVLLVPSVASRLAPRWPRALPWFAWWPLVFCCCTAAVSPALPPLPACAPIAQRLRATRPDTPQATLAHRQGLWRRAHARDADQGRVAVGGAPGGCRAGRRAAVGCLC